MATSSSACEANDDRCAGLPLLPVSVDPNLWEDRGRYSCEMWDHPSPSLQRYQDMSQVPVWKPQLGEGVEDVHP